MAKEIERTFLVSNSAWRDRVEAEIHIRQFYLAAASGRTVRIRISDGASAMLTLKFSGKGRGRDEFEYAVPLAEAEEMQAFAIGRVIEKTRCHVRHRGYLYEVDVFGGELAAEIRDVGDGHLREIREDDVVGFFEVGLDLSDQVIFFGSHGRDSF